MGFVSLSPQGFKQQALAVSTDPEHRFELALQLGELKIAYQLAVEAEVRKYLNNARQVVRVWTLLSHNVIIDCTIFAILSPTVRAEMEAACRAGYQQVPIWTGSGVPSSRPGLWWPAAPSHSLW